MRKFPVFTEIQVTFTVALLWFVLPSDYALHWRFNSGFVIISLYDFFTLFLKCMDWWERIFSLSRSAWRDRTQRMASH